MMTELNCCGVNDYMDFAKSEKWTANKGNKIVPDVCCLHNNQTNELIDVNCPNAPTDLNSNFRKVNIVYRVIQQYGLIEDEKLDIFF